MHGLPVGNMMQSVVLDGNPLNEDEDMRLLTYVVFDGIPLDENYLNINIVIMCTMHVYYQRNMK